MANEIRGEIELKLGEKTYVLRPSFQNICNIESALGHGLLEIVTRMQLQKFGVRDAMLIVACFNATGERTPISDQDIGEQLLEANLQAVWAQQLNFLSKIILGPNFTERDDDDEKK